MEQWEAVQKALQKRFSTYPDMLLTTLLLAASLTIAIIALLPDHHLLKVIALAYVVLP